jgi:hypothetical protein
MDNAQTAKTERNLWDSPRLIIAANPPRFARAVDTTPSPIRFSRLFFELGLMPEMVAKFSGIGCSSKSLNYFLQRSFGFNGLHGRYAHLVTGACFCRPTH